MAEQKDAKADSGGSNGGTATQTRTETSTRPQKLPPYHVVLLNDDHHSYDYVIDMLKSLFGHPRPKGLQLATQVDKSGRAIVLTTTKEHAELKRDQIHAFGPDRRIADCSGAMSAVIEPAEE